MRKLLFVTTGCLSSNPRLYKEVRHLSKKSDCTLVCFNPVSWQREFEQELEEDLGKVRIIRLKNRERGSLIALCSFIIGKLASILLPVFPNNIFLTSLATDKRSLMLHFKLKALRQEDFHFVIAHNPGTLYPVWHFATWNSKSYVFDMEDWHPGEYVEIRKTLNRKVKLNLLSKTLPAASLVTLASPLFSEKLRAHSIYSDDKTVYIANSFPSTYFNIPTDESNLKGPLRIVWFSQNITRGRGLELFLPVIKKYAGEIELTLIGYIHEETEWHQALTSLAFISIVKPMSPLQLNRYIGSFDVGIASDFQGRDENRDISVSNKIISYLQAGLYVLASETKGHRWILSGYESHGMLTDVDEESIDSALKEIIIDKDHIRGEKINRFEAARKLSWENECDKLDSIYLA